MNGLKLTVAATALMAALPMSQAFAEVGDLRMSASYTNSDTEYTFNKGIINPFVSDAADIESDSGLFAASYVVDDTITLGASYGISDIETDRPAGMLSTESDLTTIGVTALVAVSDPLSLFVGVTNLDIETDGDNGFGGRVSADSDGWAYTAGFAYDRQLDGNAFFILTGSVNYSEIDTGTINAFGGTQPGREQSVTTLTLTPEIGTVYKDLTASVGATYSRKNRDLRFVDEPTSFEVSANVSYALKNDWELRGRLSQNLGEKDTDTTRFTLGVSKTINLLNRGK